MSKKYDVVEDKVLLTLKCHNLPFSCYDLTNCCHFLLALVSVDLKKECHKLMDFHLFCQMGVTI